MAKRDNGYKNAYSNRGHCANNRGAQGNNLNCTQVFDSVSTERCRQPRSGRKPSGPKTEYGTGLSSINLSLTIIIVALLMCLVVFLAIYNRMI